MRVAFAVTVSLCLTAAASAHDFKVGDLVVAHPWSRATPPGAKIGAGYVAVTNTGTEPDRLIGGSTAVSQGFELHESQVTDGVARMRPLEEGLEIAPGQTVTLAPGGTHAMLTGLSAPIRQGEPFKGTLVFEKAGPVEVEFAVEGFGAAPAPEGDHGGHGG